MHQPYRKSPLTIVELAPRENPCLGVLVEDVSAVTLSAVFRDLLTYCSSMPPGCRLQVISNEGPALGFRSGGCLPVDFVSLPVDQCKNWVGYFNEKRPEIPEGVANVLWKRVGTSGNKAVILRHNDKGTIPLPTRPQIMVPVSQSPSTMTMPSIPKGVPSPLPLLYPWM